MCNGIVWSRRVADGPADTKLSPCLSLGGLLAKRHLSLNLSKALNEGDGQTRWKGEEGSMGQNVSVL